MKRFSLFLFISLLISSNLIAKITTFDAGTFLSLKKENFKTINAAGKYSFFEINNIKLANELKSSNSLIINNFPTALNTLSTIKLDRAKQVYDQNTKFVTQTNNGEIEIPAPDCEVFTGKIVGEDNSEIKFIYINNSVFCSITNLDGERYFLAPNNGNIEELILVSEKDFYLGKNFRFNCNTNYIKNEINKQITDKVLSNNNLLELEVALETDSEFFKATGGTLVKAQAYAIAIFSLINSIYEKELNITLYIPWFKCWSDSPSDPYNCKGDPFVLRDKAGPYWKANYSNIKRDIFHVITAISYGGGGFGYLDALCGINDFGFATSSIQVQHTYPTFTFTYDVYIVAHELGHNLNGQHTHSCYWGYPLDTCLVDEAKSNGCLDTSIKARPNPGSIMSYCGGTNMSFGLGYQVRMTFLPQNQTLMRKTAEAATCITEPPISKIIIRQPNSSESLQAGIQYDIIFASTRVDKINLKYSSDNGKTWNGIASNINSTDGKFTWTTPDICSNSCILIINSSLDNSIGDTSILPFSIYKTKPVDLVGKYYFDNDLNNSICGGFANSISVGSGVSFTTDRFGLKDSAIALNGSGYLMIPQADLTNNELSVSLWLNGSDFSTKRFMIGTNSGPGLNVFEIYYWGLIGCSYYLKEGLWQFWGSGASPNNWFHIVFTYDGNEANFYLNGNLNKTEKKTGTLIPFNTSIYIGSRKGAEPFIGKLDDIRIYRKALTANEVMDIYTDKKAPLSPILISPNDKFETSLQSINLKWAKTESTINYRLQVADNISFENNYLLLDTIVKDTSFIFKTNSIGEYFWRINAINPFGISPWSSTRSLIIFETDVEEVVSLPVMIIYQNRPNPSENKIIIHFELSKPAKSELIVSNQIKNIMSLNLGLLNTGSHNVELDFSNEPSGAYFYSLKTEFGKITKKLEIIK